MAIDASDAVTSHSGPIFWFVGPRISEAKYLYMPPCWNFPYKMIELESRINPKNYIYVFIRKIGLANLHLIRRQF